MTVDFLVASAVEVTAALNPMGGVDRFLPGAVRVAAAGYRREQDKVSYRAGHAVFRLMAARALGTDPLHAAALPVSRCCRNCGSTLHGKPAVAGVQLSLSRSAGLVLVASAPASHPIGADLERIVDTVFDGFDGYALSAAELAELEPDDAVSRLRLWVAKEAILKATGHGLGIEPHTLSITGAPPTGPGSTSGRGACTGLAAADGLELNWVEVPEGYAGALAVPAGSTVSGLELDTLLG